MTIDGVSQTTGPERQADISAEADGLKLTIRDRKPEAVLASVIVPADALKAVLTGRPTGPQAVDGNLEAEGCRNKGWLRFGGPGVAVGWTT
jgi:hypothetical protein